MKRQVRHWKGLLLALAVSAFPALVSCSDGEALDRIKGSGKITVLTRNNAHCYYTYRDKPMGYEYDLAKAFSNYLGVELEVVTPHPGKIGWISPPCI